MTYIGQEAFEDCAGIKSIKMSNNIKKISMEAFNGCNNLWSISIPDTIVDGGYQVIGKNIRYINLDKYISGFVLEPLAEVECLKSGSSERYSEIQKDGKIKKYLITETKNISSESFSGINGIRIFINALQNEDLPQGWNNGNKVYYKDQWHYAEFDSDGVILQMNPTPNGEVLQVPSASMVKDLLPEGAEFAGWDINGDGLVDKLPVTLTEDIYAEAVYNVDIKSISLDEQTTVEKGYTKKLEVKYSPAHYTVEGGVTFTSSDESIVTVDSEGILTGVKEGTADVTAVLNNNPSVTASCTVEVVAPSYGIRFEPNYGQLNAGETLQLEPELKLPEEEISAESVITWKSEDETIATVENGLIVAAAPGSVTITASCGEYTADYYLTVLAPLEEISVDPKEGSLNVGETQKLKVSYLPANTTDDKTVTWFSTRSSVATVDDEGLVTAVGSGTAKIKAAVGNKITTYEVTVKAPLKWIKLNTTTGTMRLNRTKQMEVIYEPVNTTDDKTAVWTSTDPQVASVDESGRVTAVSRGKAVITAKVGDFTASYYVTVIGLRDETTGIIVSNSDETEMDEDMLLYVSEIRKNNWKLFEEILRKIIAAISEERAKLYGFTAYDISLLQSGQTVQPGTTVDVDIPAGVREDAVVYRVENDGSLTDMHVIADEEGYYSFETEHFSTYVLGIRHNWSTTPLEEKKATCTEAGWITYKCQDCDEINKIEVPALGHDYGGWKELKAATCTEAGTEERTCKRDKSHKETRNIPALGHQEKVVAEIPATCTEPGRSAGVECTVCGEVLSGEEELSALGHDYGEWIIIKAPTEKEEGEAERTCKRDTSHKETKKLAALGHHHQEKEVPEIPATCTEPGRTAGVECETCGEILRGEEKLPALGHDYGEWKELKAATCTEAGTEERTCKRDASHKETRKIAALGHQEKEVAEIPATCTEPGRSAGTECAVCGEVLSGESELPALGHDYGDWITVKEPTYTEEGTEEQVCSRDSSHRVTRSIPKLKRPLSECEIKLSDTAYVYDGGEIRPEVTVSYNETVLIEGIDYTLSYENNIDPGTATVTIEAAENSGYIGTVQKNFAIRAVLDEYVTVVQPGAFKGCANLTNVNIRSTVTGIGEQAFADCKNLRNIYFYGNCPETGKDMFQNVTANAYYPYNDLTWSMDKLQDYGGNITWCPWNPQTGEPARRDLSICEMTVSAKDLTYNGKAQTPQITVTDSGKVLQEGVDYTVTYKDNVKVGTATVTATGAGIYGGSITTRFVISKASNTIKVSDITKTASSKSQTVKTTVRVYGGAKLTYSSNNKSVKVDKTGKLTIAKNFAGKAVITVKSSETSCYKAASKKFNVTVKPAAVTISKASNSAKQKITVSWKKNTTCSGYAVQYSTDKSCKKGVKTVYISKNSTVKATLSKLTKGKTYYVRIASYKKSGSTKIYSAWSKVKSIKVKK